METRPARRSPHRVIHVPWPKISTEQVGTYSRACAHLWKQTDDIQWFRRMQALQTNKSTHKLIWLQWVEKNAEAIPWCGQLVVTAVTLSLSE